jgi:hypothetical protein
LSSTNQCGVPAAQHGSCKPVMNSSSPLNRLESLPAGLGALHPVFPPVTGCATSQASKKPRPTPQPPPPPRCLESALSQNPLLVHLQLHRSPCLTSSSVLVHDNSSRQRDGEARMCSSPPNVTVTIPGGSGRLQALLAAKLLLVAATRVPTRSMFGEGKAVFVESEKCKVIRFGLDSMWRPIGSVCAARKVGCCAPNGSHT